MIDPGIKEDPDYWVYKQMVEGEHYCKEETGKIFIGNCLASCIYGNLPLYHKR